MCIFCKIINREIPASILYEDEDVFAMLDIAQVTDGHTLVMPKEHVDNILDCPPVLLSKIISVTQMLSKDIVRKLDAKGVNVLTNANPAAGQSVMHFHMHIIPRYDESDGLILRFKENPTADIKRMENILKK
ncbi:MAG: HIT family protein [Firmicutes bacterium HGW-Firmicutes-10]|jgi:histidine triad (HIT) family protein|nr:MAG: HIT family protein [Firmicutes bacterium HGW-Firmicutes-10]